MRPYTALQLRTLLQARAVSERSKQPAPRCSVRQAALVARYMDSLYTMRFIRLAVLEWLVGRDLQSSKDISAAEASAALDWLSSDPAQVRLEAAAVLVAVFMAMEPERVIA